MVFSGQKVAARKRTSGRVKALVCLAPLLLAAGCAAFPTMNATTARPNTGERALTPEDIAAGETRSSQSRSPDRLAVPGRAQTAPVRPSATQAQIEALLPDEPVDANLAPQPIPQFAATVFGGLLGLPYTLSADVASRPEIIAGGTGGVLSKRDLFRLTQQALRQYGIEVYINGNSVTVGGGDAAAIGAQVARDRAVQGGAGRVVQFFNVQTIEVNALQALLQDLFPNLRGARITPDPLTNSLIIAGPGREVAQVVSTLRELDQPRFAGSEVIRVEPVYWSADNLAASLDQVLTTEGYVVSRQAAAGRSVVILAFPAANQVLVFAQDPALLDRVRYWVANLDRPAALGDKPSTFVYQARNTDAQSLAQLAIGQSVTQPQVQRPVGVPGTVAVDTTGTQTTATSGSSSSTRASTVNQPGASGQFMNGRVLADPIGNRIIFTGTATEFAELRTLLTTLDIPAPQVVIEVMIAEVTLTDDTDIGVTLFGREVRGDGLLSGSTEGLQLSGIGNFTFVGPDFRARVVANASNRRVNILQSPRLVTRSGQLARFQVGSDVPIITSQRATDFQPGPGLGSDVLQSVQYRQTGTILEITPVIYGDRVDIQISQELSSAGAPPTGTNISSPTILNRSLTTQIAITDGWTGVLGGLIGNNYEKSNTGLPFLKDIPVVGSLFQSNSVAGTRTELLLLITPHIIRGDEDMADFADRYSADMNSAFRTGRGWSYTLTPWSFGSRVRGVGFDLPSAEPASQRLPLLPRFGGSSAVDSEATAPEPIVVTPPPVVEPVVAEPAV